jgi:hypothetical protein
MEPSTPIEQPQHIVKAWSHRVIGNVTLLAMLTLIVLGWFPRVSISIQSALALGAFAGFVVAAINWFRMGRRWKGLFHLLISPAIYLIFLFGIPYLWGLIIRLLSGGSPERAADLIQVVLYSPGLTLYFIAAFIVIAYLYSMTKRDTARLQGEGVSVQYADFLPPMGIAALSVIILWGVSVVAGQAYRASVQNHIYCELLHPEMTQEEVTTALKEIGPLYQRTTGGLPSQYQRKDGGEYRFIFWRESDVELRYRLWLWVGYDKNGKLDWVGRDSLSDGLVPIQCPWTFYQSVTAR